MQTHTYMLDRVAHIVESLDRCNAHVWCSVLSPAIQKVHGRNWSLAHMPPESGLLRWEAC